MLKRWSMTALSAILLIAMFGPLPQRAAADASSYYVATDGDDGNPGTLAEPFRTIQKAADMAEPGDTVVIRGGTYRETVTPANSGTPGNPITYLPYDGEEVTVSGADPVTAEWTVHSGAVYKATTSIGSLPADKRQLFVDGEMMVEARWPNVDSQNAVLNAPAFRTAGSASSTQITDSDGGLDAAENAYQGARIWLEDSHHWVAQTRLITASAGASITFEAAHDEALPGAGSRYYIFGKLELLDAAKEWYYSDGGDLYLYAPGGASPSNVEYKARDYAFDLADKSYIQIKGLNVFAGTIHTTSGSSHHTLDGINAEYVTHTNVPGYPWGDSTTGLVIKGDNHTLKNSTIAYSSGNCVVIEGSGSSIVNNEIHECNYNGTDNAGIYISTYYEASDNLLAHNTIYNTGRGAILMKYAPQTRIAYNDISSFSKLMDDAGALYVFRTDGMGSEIDHNLIHDGSDGLVAGIYLDNGSSNYLVHHNVIWNVPYSLYMNTPNNFSLVYNNTLLSPGRIGGDGWYNGQLFNNITGAVSPSNLAVYGMNLQAGVTNIGFIDGEAGNYRLSSGSPAIDVGKVIPGMTDGYAGTAPDIGAYEFGGADWTAGHSFDNPPNPIHTLTSADYRNLLRNSDFEHGLSNWTTTHAGEAASDNSSFQSGWNNIRLGTSEDGVRQEVTGLSPNTTYTLSGWGKAGSGDTTARLGVMYGEADEYAAFESTTMERKSLTFTTGADVTSVTVYFYRPAGGTGHVYGDNFGLSLVQPEAGPFFLKSTSYLDNIVVNPGFESDYEGWTGDWSNTSITTDPNQVRSGSKALRIGTANGGRLQPITEQAVPGASYRLSGWLKVSRSGDSVFLGLSFMDAEGGFIEEHKLTFSSTEYEYKELVVEAPAHAAAMNVFTFENGTGDYVYVDDVALEQAAPEYTDNTVANPGFESDYEGWTGDWSNTAITAEPAHVHSGAKALQIGTANGGRLQPIAVQAIPGETYRLSGWLKVTSGGDNVFLGLSFADGEDGFIEEHKLQFTSTDYEYKEVVVEAPANAARMNVFVFENGTSGYVYADDIALQRAFSAAIDLDKTAPVGTIVINDGGATTQSQEVTLKLTAADTGSGVYQMRFSPDDASWTEWEAFAETKLYTLTDGYGSKTVYVRYRDVKGNISPSYNDSITYSSGSSTEGGGASPTVPVKQARPADVAVGSLGGIGVDIMRSLQNGSHVDEVKLDFMTTQQIAALAASQKQRTVNIGIHDLPNAPADEIKVDIPMASVRELAKAGISLEIRTGGALIAIPAETWKLLEAQGTDADFRIVPIRKADEKQIAEDRVVHAEEVQKAARGNDVDVIGNPVIIEASYTNAPTKVVLPLSSLPASGPDRQTFLASLVVYIEHSDGDKELARGRIVKDAEGAPIGIEIEVSKFSTFTLLSIQGQGRAYINGYPDGTFKPDKAITRAEFGSMIVEFIGEQLSSRDTSFIDVPATHWAAGAIAALERSGLGYGYPDGSFRPDASLSRAEAAWIVYQLGKAEAGSSDEVDVFSDTANHPAAAVFSAVHQMGFMTGYPDGTFRPDRLMTRAECTVLLNRLFGIQPSVEDAVQSSWSDVPKGHWASAYIEAASKRG